MDNTAVGTADGSPSWRRAGLSVVFDEVNDSYLLPVAEVLLQVAALPPGGEAITLLQGLAGREMSGSERLRVVELWQPQLAWVTGAEQSAVLAFAGPTPDRGDAAAVLADEFVPTSLARVLHSSSNHAFDRVFQARQLSEQCAELGDLLRAGALDWCRVRIITDHLGTLQNPEHAAAVQAAILPLAGSLSTAKLRKELRRLARQVDPLWNTKLFLEARKTRRVVFDPLGQDGLVGMHAYLPPVEALAMHDHLTKAAQTGPVNDDDERGHDERMCDALIGTVLGTAPGDPSTPMAPNVLVNVFVPVPVLLGLQAALADDTGTEPEATVEVEGLGVLPAGLLTDLARDAKWRRWVLEPVTGHLLDLGRERYRPDRTLDEFVRARDRYCRYPGCNRRAIRCDLDHLCPWCQAHPDQGGSTSAANLAAECRRHHRGKTLRLLTVTGDANNTLTWTDQHGQTATTDPHNYHDGL